MTTRKILTGMLSAVLMLTAGGFSGCSDDDTENGSASVETLDAENVTVSSADLKGKTAGNTSGMMARGICYNTLGTPTVNDDMVSATKGAGEYTLTAYELKHSTKYFIRAFAMYPTGVVYGAEKSFTTLAVAVPTVTIEEPTSVTSISALFTGEVVSAGGFPILEAGFCWSTEPDPDIENGEKYSVEEPGVGPILFDNQLLANNTTYYVRAFARTEAGVGYSETITFTTLDLKLPELTLNPIGKENTGIFTLDVEAAITEANGTVTRKGFCWSTSPNPTVSDNVVEAGGETFTARIEGLKPYTKYYVAAFAVNEGGTGYSQAQEVRTFTYGMGNDRLVLITPPASAYLMGWTSTKDGLFTEQTQIDRNKDEKNPMPMPVQPEELGTYYMGKYEVTNSEYAEFMTLFQKETIEVTDIIDKKETTFTVKMFDASTIKIEKVGDTWRAKGGHENKPVAGVTYYGALEFCKFYGGTLPNEAQWEFAARGGKYTDADKTMYAGSDNIDEVAWYKGNASGPQDVGQKAPNGYGLYDMSGNVSELTCTWYQNYKSDWETFASQQNNGSKARTIRGGNYSNDVPSNNKSDLRCIHRSTLDNTTDGTSKGNVGFRFCLPVTE